MIDFELRCQWSTYNNAKQSIQLNLQTLVNSKIWLPTHYIIPIWLDIFDGCSLRILTVHVPVLCHSRYLPQYAPNTCTERTTSQLLCRNGLQLPCWCCIRLIWMLTSWPSTAMLDSVPDLHCVMYALCVVVQCRDIPHCTLAVCIANLSMWAICFAPHAWPNGRYC